AGVAHHHRHEEQRDHQLDEREPAVDEVADEPAHRPLVAGQVVALVAGLHRGPHALAGLVAGGPLGTGLLLAVAGDLGAGPGGGLGLASGRRGAALAVGFGDHLRSGGLGLRSTEHAAPSESEDRVRSTLPSWSHGLAFAPRVKGTTSQRSTTRGRTPMSLMKRISLIFRSKANKAIDRAEDP